MFCTNCGQQLSDSVKFCENCGARVDAAAPQIPVTAAEQAAPVRKKKKLWPLLTILAVVIIGAAAAAAFLLTAKKSVYLPTKTTTVTANGITTTYRYEYDDEGRVIEHVYEVEYPEEYEYMDDIKVEICYEYDENGKLIAAEFDTYGKSFEVEYEYSGDVLECFHVEVNDYSLELEVECDDSGRIEEIKPSEDDSDISSFEYEYHDSGVLKSCVMEGDVAKTEQEYNEQGKLIESKTYLHDELVSRIVLDYDDQGNLTLQESHDGDGELTMKLELEYTYEDEMLTGMTMGIEAPNGDGELLEAEIVFECEWDGLECEMTIDDISGDEEALESISNSTDELEIHFEVDEAGNLLSYEMNAGEDTTMSGTNEYEEFKVSRDYEEVNIRIDPMYLYFLLNL